MWYGARIRGFVVACIAIVLGCQSPHVDFNEPLSPEERLTLGELVFGILRTNLERADDCSVELVEQLDRHRDRFVITFDYTISHQFVEELPEFLGGTLLPLVDSGDLPALTDSLAEAMAILVSDELDPDRDALGAVLTLAQTRTVLQASHAIDLVTQLLADPAIKNRIHALTRLLLERDGERTLMDSTLDLAVSTLRDVDEPGRCEGLDLGNLQHTLLTTDGFVVDPEMGGPAWVVRADRHGNPRVATDPATGELHLPFVDTDRDGAADVDAEGRPVDRDGNVLTVAPFDDRANAGADYAPDGRRLAENGEPLYDYYDAKQSALSHLVQLTRDVLVADIHRDAAEIAGAALGDPVSCGEASCYDSEDHPVANLSFAFFELIRYERAAAWIDTFGSLLRDQPWLAERLLIAGGELLSAIDESGIDVTGPELLDLVEGMLPLIAEIAAADNTTGESTARLILDVVHALGETARGFPTQLGYTVDYARLHKAPECSAEPPDLAASVSVNYDQPRYYQVGNTWVDNRSSLEQSIELLAAADCGSVPFTGGRSVAYVAIDLLANSDPDDVCALIDTLLGLLDIVPGAGRFATVAALDLIGCDGDAVYDELQALDDLARSGALDFYLPVARVFKQRGQLDTLIELLQYLAADLARDHDGDVATNSSIRRLLPLISTLIEHDAGDALFDFIDIVVTVPAADGNGTMADVMVDSLARTVVTDDIRTRAGPTVVSSLAQRLLDPLQVLVARVRQADNEAELERIVDHVHGYLGTTVEPTGERRLTNRNLVPLLRVLLETATRAASLSREDYLCYVDELQDGTEQMLTGPDFATGVRLLGVLEESEPGRVVEEWALGFITPERRVDRDLYGPLMQVVAGSLESHFEADTLLALLDYVGTVAEQRRGDEASMLYTFDSMLQHDESDAVLTIARTLVEAGPLESRERPVSTFGDIFGDVAGVTEPAMCGADARYQFSSEDAEDLVGGVVDFLRDEYGLYAIYELFGRRTRRE